MTTAGSGRRSTEKVMDQQSDQSADVYGALIAAKLKPE